MAPRKKDKELVRPVDEMLQLDLRRHVQARHKLMRLITRGEHEADHRLHPTHLDHVHRNQQEEQANASHGS